MQIIYLINTYYPKYVNRLHSTVKKKKKKEGKRNNPRNLQAQEDEVESRNRSALIGTIILTKIQRQFIEEMMGFTMR